MSGQRRIRVSAQDDEAPLYTWVFYLIAMGVMAAVTLAVAVFYAVVAVGMFIGVCVQNGVRPTVRTLIDNLK